MFAQETAASALARPLSAAEQQWLAAHSLIGIVVRLTPEMAALANAEEHCALRFRNGSEEQAALAARTSASAHRQRKQPVQGGSIHGLSERARLRGLHKVFFEGWPCLPEGRRLHAGPFASTNNVGPAVQGGLRAVRARLWGN